MNIRASLTRRSFGRVISVTAGVAVSAMAITALPATAAKKEPGVSATEIVLGMQLPQEGPASPGYNKVDDAMRGYFDYVISTTFENPASANSFIKCGFKTSIPATPWGAAGTIYWTKTIA